MAFTKKTYTSGQTAITADNLNAIQDELIRVGGSGTSPVADYVVEQGTSDIWAYRKWNSGFAECWLNKNRSVTGAAPSAILGGAFYSFGELYTPFTFVGYLKGIADASLGSGLGFTNVTVPSFSKIRIYVIGNQESNDIEIQSIYLYGRWK